MGPEGLLMLPEDKHLNPNNFKGSFDEDSHGTSKINHGSPHYRPAEQSQKLAGVEHAPVEAQYVDVHDRAEDLHHRKVNGNNHFPNVPTHYSGGELHAQANGL